MHNQGDSQQKRRDVIRGDDMTSCQEKATAAAHALRDPMTAIKILVQRNQEEFKQQGMPNEDLQIIVDEIRRMEGLLATILENTNPSV